MKILLIFALSLACISAFGQSTLPLRADTVVIEKIGGSATLKIKNPTRDTIGVLANIGGGATAFLKPKRYNDTCIIIGRDTICGVGGRTNLVAGSATTVTGTWPNLAVNWNGPMTTNAIINSGSFYVDIRGTRNVGSPLDTNTVMYVGNAGSGYAFRGRSHGYTPTIQGVNESSGSALYGISKTGITVFGVSLVPKFGAAFHFRKVMSDLPTIDTAVVGVFAAQIEGSGNGAFNSGGRIDFSLSGTTGEYRANRMLWLNDNSAPKSSRFELWGTNNNVEARKFAIAPNGAWTWDGYAGTNLETADSTTYKPLGINAAGDVRKFPSWLGGGSGGAAPGGSDTYVQINDGGIFGGDAGLIFNKTTNKLTTDTVRAVKSVLDSLAIGTSHPTHDITVSRNSAASGNGVSAKLTDTRTSGDYRMASLQLQTDDNFGQFISMNGIGFSFAPFNSISGSYLRNVTANRSWFFTNNRSGTEAKSMWLNGDSVALGYNSTFTAPLFAPVSPGFGGYPVVIGAHATGSGVAVGWHATATNLEATAIGPQAYADGLATIAIGDGTRAMASTWGGNIGIGGTLPASTYGNQIVMGDAAYTRGNINFFMGGGMGINHNFGIGLGCAGSSTLYDLSITTADHQGFLGGYAENSVYFNFNASGSGQGVGLANDWWLGGPVRATWPHDITLRTTSMIGTNRNGIAFGIYGSRATGSGTGGPIDLYGSVVGSSGTTLQDSVRRFRFDALGKMFIYTKPDSAATATGGYLFLDAATSQVKIGPGGSGSGSYTFSTGLNNSSGTVTNLLSTGVSGGQSVVGGTGSAEALTISSTSHATKGKINFGSTGTFSEVNSRMVIGSTTVGTTNMLYAEGSNNDGGGTTIPTYHFKNTNAVDPGGAGYNIAGGTFSSGNGAVMAQFVANYGTGAGAPFNVGSAFLITTRTDHPIIFATGATTAERFRIKNDGVINIVALAGAGTRALAVNNSGDITATASLANDLAIVNDADYTVTATVSAVRYHATVTASRTLTIPNASTYPGREIKIKFNGFAGADSVTITSASTIYLNGLSGSTTQPVNTPTYAVTLKSDGASWYQIN